MTACHGRTISNDRRPRWEQQTNCPLRLEGMGDSCLTVAPFQRDDDRADQAACAWSPVVARGGNVVRVFCLIHKQRCAFSFAIVWHDLLGMGSARRA